jgi:hypothetical protein
MSDDRVFRADDERLSREPMERAEIEVIAVAMRQESHVNGRQTVEIHPARWAKAEDALAKRRHQVGIHQNVDSVSLPEEASVSNERGLHRSSGRRIAESNREDPAGPGRLSGSGHATTWRTGRPSVENVDSAREDVIGPAPELPYRQGVIR